MAGAQTAEGGRKSLLESEMAAAVVAAELAGAVVAELAGAATQPLLGK